ncbi:hypothetical protein ACFWP3_19315 [Streptomyces sp. NPDC058525]|uniref:hypothetical protein n=1 Tax=Streptomyces sp. NPDC058525 TaxID=3346538 RepID=UPI003667B3D4
MAKLMVAAHAEPERIKQAHVLLDLMVAVGLVTVEASGELHWFEGASHTDTPPPDTHDASASQTQEPQAGGQDGPGQGEEPADAVGEGPSGSAHEDSPGRQDGPEQPQGQVPHPRPEPRGDQADPVPRATGREHDLLSLLLPPLLLADLTRLTPTEVLELHSHLTAITALTAKLRGPRVT